MVVNQDWQKQMVHLVNSLRAQMLDRDHEAFVAVAALLSRHHMFMLGSPGVAKSLLVNTLLNTLGDNLKGFIWLLGPTTDIQEIVGNISLKDYEERDIFRYNTRNKLPEANVAFLDEIWKAQSGLLNMLLTLLNERRFDNGDGAVQAPLLSCFAASNELPKGAELAALYDRFGPRLVVNPVGNRESFKSLLTFKPAKITPLNLSYEDLLCIMNEVDNVEVTEEFTEAMTSLWEVMKTGCPDVYVSDRRWRESIRYLKACAYLGGGRSLDQDSIWNLRDFFWSDPKDYVRIATSISQCCSSQLSMTQVIHNEVTAMLNKIMSMTKGQVVASTITEMRKTISAQQETIDALIEKYPAKAPMMADTQKLVRHAKIKLGALL